MTQVINLYGGPGCGKSTLSCEIFYRMKRAGLSVELVREYVKDWAWENRKVGQYDQLYITGKQSKREAALYHKVDWIVTDSPLFLSCFYQQYYQQQTFTLPAVLGHLEFAKSNGVTHHHFLLSRNKAYNPAGRYETEEQATAIDLALGAFLGRTGVDFREVDVPDREKADAIFSGLGVEA